MAPEHPKVEFLYEKSILYMLTDNNVLHSRLFRATSLKELGAPALTSALDFVKM